MTPDGIATEDWDRVHECALAIVNAEDDVERDSHTAQLLDVLKELGRRYGERPSILAIEAHYINIPEWAETLLLRAFEIAERERDLVNQLCAALSLVELYVKELRERTAARHWLGRAESILWSGSQHDRETWERLANSLAEPGE